MKRVLAPWLLLCLVASLAGCRAAKVDIAVDIDQEEQAQLGPLMRVNYHPSDTARALAMNTAYAEATNAFGLDLWQRLPIDDGNQAFSPASTFLALSMTWTGAVGQTAIEMAEILRLDTLTGPPEPAARAQLERWDRGQPDQLRLEVANRIYTAEGFPPLPAFRERIAASYRADAEALVMGDGARQHINAWVSEQTGARIPELLPAGAVTPATAMVLVNAIAFIGQWAQAFDAADTVERPFRLSSGDEASVPTMERTGVLRHLVRDDVRAVELPYVGDELAMLLVGPGPGGVLADLEATLSATALADWVDGLQEGRVELRLPTFRIEGASLPLSGPLQDMGMRRAFADADFSDMFAGSGVVLSEVLHQVFVEVDERGTEAAAATAVVVTRGAARPAEPLWFDSPFLFLIRDRRTGMVLFMGRVADPASKPHQP